MYARQAQNTEAERKAGEIRLRAERKCGELLAEQAASGERQTPGGDRRSSSDDTRMKLRDANISYDRSSDWQRLAAIPAAEFEADLADPMWMPTTRQAYLTSQIGGRPTVEYSIHQLRGGFCHGRRTSS
jgi:hypothetical protein